MPHFEGWSTGFALTAQHWAERNETDLNKHSTSACVCELEALEGSLTVDLLPHKNDMILFFPACCHILHSSHSFYLILFLIFPPLLTSCVCMFVVVVHGIVHVVLSCVTSSCNLIWIVIVGYLYQLFLSAVVNRFHYTPSTGMWASKLYVDWMIIYHSDISFLFAHEFRGHLKNEKLCCIFFVVLLVVVVAAAVALCATILPRFMYFHIIVYSDTSHSEWFEWFLFLWHSHTHSLSPFISFSEINFRSTTQNMDYWVGYSFTFFRLMDTFCTMLYSAIRIYKHRVLLFELLLCNIENMTCWT